MENNENLSNVLIMADRIARLYYWMVKGIVEEIGEERAEKVVEKIISDYGRETGELARKAVEEQKMVPSMSNYKMSRDLPTVGWKSEVLESTEENFIKKTTFCPFADSWKKHYPNEGFEKWAKIYCSIDRTKYQTYIPGCQSLCSENVMDNGEYCILEIKK